MALPYFAPTSRSDILTLSGRDYSLCGPLTATFESDAEGNKRGSSVELLERKLVGSCMAFKVDDLCSTKKDEQPVPLSFLSSLSSRLFLSGSPGSSSTVCRSSSVPSYCTSGFSRYPARASASGVFFAQWRAATMSRACSARVHAYTIVEDATPTRKDVATLASSQVTFASFVSPASASSTPRDSSVSVGLAHSSGMTTPQKFQTLSPLDFGTKLPSVSLTASRRLFSASTDEEIIGQKEEICRSNIPDVSGLLVFDSQMGTGGVSDARSYCSTSVSTSASALSAVSPPSSPECEGQSPCFTESSCPAQMTRGTTGADRGGAYVFSEREKQEGEHPGRLPHDVDRSFEETDIVSLQPGNGAGGSEETTRKTGDGSSEGGERKTSYEGDDYKSDDKVEGKKREAGQERRAEGAQGCGGAGAGEERGEDLQWKAGYKDNENDKGWTGFSILSPRQKESQSPCPIVRDLAISGSGGRARSPAVLEHTLSSRDRDPPYRRDCQVPVPRPPVTTRRSPRFSFLPHISSDRILKARAALSPGKPGSPVYQTKMWFSPDASAQVHVAREATHAEQLDAFSVADVPGVIAGSVAACEYAEETSRASAAALERAAPLLDHPMHSSTFSRLDKSPRGPASLLMWDKHSDGGCVDERQKLRSIGGGMESASVEQGADGANLNGAEVREVEGTRDSCTTVKPEATVETVRRTGEPQGGEWADAKEEKDAQDKSGSKENLTHEARVLPEDTTKVKTDTVPAAPFPDGEGLSAARLDTQRGTMASGRGDRGDSCALQDRSQTKTVFSSVGTAAPSSPTRFYASFRRDAPMPRCSSTFALPTAFLHGQRMTATFWISEVPVMTKRRGREDTLAGDQEQTKLAQEWLAPGLRDFAEVLCDEFDTTEDETDEEKGLNQECDHDGESCGGISRDTTSTNSVKGRISRAGSLSRPRRVAESNFNRGAQMSRSKRHGKMQQPRVYIQTLAEGLDALEDVVHHSKLLAFKFIHAHLVSNPLSSLPASQEPRPEAFRERSHGGSSLSISSFPFSKNMHGSIRLCVGSSRWTSGSLDDGEHQQRTTQGDLYDSPRSEREPTLERGRVQEMMAPSEDSSRGSTLPTLLSGMGSKVAGNNWQTRQDTSVHVKRGSEQAGQADDRRLRATVSRTPTWASANNVEVGGEDDGVNAEGRGTGNFAATGIGFAIQTMADFHLSVAYLLGEVLKREREEKDFYKTEVALVRERLQDVEARALEAATEAQKQLEEQDDQAKHLTEQLAKQSSELRRALEQQEVLRRTLHEEQRKMMLQHEAEVDMLNKQYASLLRDFQRRGHQLERLQSDVRGMPRQSHSARRETAVVVPDLGEMDLMRDAPVPDGVNEPEEDSSPRQENGGFRKPRRESFCCGADAVSETEWAEWNPIATYQGVDASGKGIVRCEEVKPGLFSHLESSGNAFSMTRRDSVSSRRMLLIAAATDGIGTLSRKRRLSFHTMANSTVSGKGASGRSSGGEQAETDGLGSSYLGDLNSVRKGGSRWKAGAFAMAENETLSSCTQRFRGEYGGGGTLTRMQCSLEDELLEAVSLDQRQESSPLSLAYQCASARSYSRIERVRTDEPLNTTRAESPQLGPGKPSDKVDEDKDGHTVKPGLEGAEFDNMSVPTPRRLERQERASVQRTRGLFACTGPAIFAVLLLAMVDQLFLGGCVSSAALRCGEWGLLLLLSGTQELQRVVRHRDHVERYTMPLLRGGETLLLSVLALVRACSTPGDDAEVLSYTEMFSDQFDTALSVHRIPPSNQAVACAVSFGQYCLRDAWMDRLPSSLTDPQAP
ncbi:UNVERIFIED_CONTAM: hypothetical protein HHA_266690 [Hammondia hammondi]|eukprot:XP_008888431.1 hypothetical protein HHA_266690 [Hammondia hammondi]